MNEFESQESDPEKFDINHIELTGFIRLRVYPVRDENPYFEEENGKLYLEYYPNSTCLTMDHAKSSLDELLPSFYKILKTYNPGVFGEVFGHSKEDTMAQK
ncbi:hypothetical protein JXB41_03010 [Candidatus Woesearchaeota archaeon]|nr:hypothetical protein [Candidatus Woesearchaeota archaeon]